MKKIIFLLLTLLLFNTETFSQISFTEITTPFEAVSYSSIAFADIDGDNDQDILITGRSDSGDISKLYKNDGAGSFTLVANTPFDGVEKSSIAFADIDGDNDQDVLITGDNSSSSISKLYKNDGSGNFSLVPDTPFEAVSYSSIAFADIDGDNDQDVLITGYNSSSSISKLYKNDGSGNFSLVSGTLFEGVRSSSIAFADIDGDNDQDVLITGFEPNNYKEISKLYRNNGSGVFTLVPGTPFDGVSFSSIAFADIDGDNDQDVLITGAEGYVKKSKLYKNDGNGNFSLVSGTPFDSVAYPSIAFADIDGDNDQDVLITGHTDSARISKLYKNDGNGNFSLVPDTPFDSVYYSSIAFADIDGDNKQDVMITGYKVYNQYISKIYRNTTIYSPIIATTTAMSITKTSVALGGNVTNDNGFAVTERGVIYSTTNQTPVIGGANVIKDTNGTGTGVFSETINNLRPGVIYFYRAYAINSDGIGYGEVKSFTTLGVSINSITRQNPTEEELFANTATFKTTFTNPVKNVDATDFTTNSQGATISSITALSTTEYAVTVNNITKRGDVHLQIKGVNGVTGTNTITTLAVPATLNTTVNQTVDDDYFDQAKIGQTYTAGITGGLKKVTFYPKDGPHKLPGGKDITADLKIYTGDETDGGAEIYSEQVTITNSTDSAGQSFTLATPQNVTQGNTYSIVLTNFSASGYAFGASKTNDEYADGHIIFSGYNPSNTSHSKIDLKIKIEEETIALSGDLTLATNAPEVNEKYNKVVPILPFVNTANATNISNTSATAGGEVVTEGQTAITERGIVYSTTTSLPKIGKTGVTKVADANTGTGTFSTALTGLDTKDIYFYRAYATNSNGTGYGEVKRFNLNNALAFDGTNDYVAISDNTALNFSNGFTIEAWIKPTDFSGNPTIFSQYDTNQRAFSMIIMSDGKIEYTVSTNGSAEEYYSTSNSLTKNEWNHVAFTYNGFESVQGSDNSGTKMIAYINGVHAGENAVTGAMHDSTFRIELGARTANNIYFEGSMDEVRIWTRALAATEVIEGMNKSVPKNASGLVAYYPMNQGEAEADNTSITEVSDLGVNSLNGTLTNFTKTGTTSNFVAGASGNNINLTEVTANKFMATGNWSDPTKWSLGIVPTKLEKAVIGANQTVTIDVDDLEIDEFELENEATLDIPKTKEITINNSFVTNGNLSLQSDETDSGVLFVEGTAVGDITYKRGGLKANKWHIVTPPVSGQTVKTFAENALNDIRTNTTVSPVRYAISYYDDSQATEKWQYYNANVTATETFNAGQSYAMSRATDGEVSFTGTLTVGNLFKTLVADQWNAVGNPFTTYFPANKNGSSSFLNDNFAVLDDAFKSLYMWDSTQNKYVAVTELDAQDRSLTPGQGFFVRMKAGETEVAFQKEKRSTKPASGNTNFARNSTPSITLSMTSGQTTVTTDVKYFANATLDLDPGYDIGNYGGANLDIFTKLVHSSNTDDFTIQSLPVNNYENMIVPIGVKAIKDQEITFTASYENLPQEVSIYLEDRTKNTFTKLGTASEVYTLQLDENLDGIGRFYIHTTSSALSTNTSTRLTGVTMFTKNNELHIAGISGEKAQVKMYSVVGKEVVQRELTATENTQLTLPTLAKGVYIVTMQTTKGTYTQKVIIK